MKSQLGVSMIIQCYLEWYWSWVMSQWNKLNVLFSPKTTLFVPGVQPKCKGILFALWTTCFARFLLLKGSSGQSKKEGAKCRQSTSKLLLCSNMKEKLEWREEGFKILFLIMSFAFSWVISLLVMRASIKKATSIWLCGAPWLAYFMRCAERAGGFSGAGGVNSSTYWVSLLIHFPFLPEGCLTF